MLIREQELKGEYLISIPDRMEEGQWTALPDGRAVLLLLEDEADGVGKCGRRRKQWRADAISALTTGCPWNNMISYRMI